jgi:hypothetical protein
MAAGKGGSRTGDEENAQRSTVNAQRPMLQFDSTVKRWVLDVGRWTFAPLIGNGLALAQYPLAHRRSYHRRHFHLRRRDENIRPGWFR